MLLVRYKEDDLSVRKHLKARKKWNSLPHQVFVGGLPDSAEERQVEHHFAKYGHILHCNVCDPKDSEKNKAPYIDDHIIYVSISIYVVNGKEPIHHWCSSAFSLASWSWAS